MQRYWATFNEALRFIVAYYQAGIGLSAVAEYRCGGSGGCTKGIPHFPFNPTHRDFTHGCRAPEWLRS
jgi:hypothetical protein